MKHTVRPPVTSNNLGEQTYILRLTSYENLSICAKKIPYIYCFLMFDLVCPQLTSGDLEVKC